MATSRSTAASAHLKERKVPSSGTTSSANTVDSSHVRRSPKSSLPSSPERESTRLTQRRPLTSPAGSVSRTAKSQQPSSSTTAPSRRLPATKKPSDPKPLSSSLQSKLPSTSLASRQTSSTTVKERTTTRTSASSSSVRTGIASKPITGTKTAKPLRSGTGQPSSVRAKSTGSITREKKTSAKAPCRSTSEEPIVVPEPEELEEEAATHVEENDSISISSPKDYESDDLKEAPETSVPEAVDTEFSNEEPDQNEANLSEQEPEQALDDEGSDQDESKDQGDAGDDTDKDSTESSDEKQAAETMEQTEEESHEHEQNHVADDAEESKEASPEVIAMAEPIASAEPEKEMAESAAEKTAVRVMSYKKPEVVQGWKMEAPKNNEVLEEARSKLLERKKSKVLALVGAFETVMSLQEPEGQTQETSAPKESNEVKDDASTA